MIRGSYFISLSASRLDSEQMDRRRLLTKDVGHDSEDDDGLALAHRLLPLLHGFVSLDNTGLLVLEAEQIGHHL